MAEKIMDCFASQTIPIYLGASKISQFFNPDGIIFIDKTAPETISETLKKLSEKDYIERIPAILDNYHRTLKYNHIDDLLWEKLKK